MSSLLFLFVFVRSAVADDFILATFMVSLNNEFTKLALIRTPTGALEEERDVERGGALYV